jgi:hypothetical protein
MYGVGFKVHGLGWIVSGLRYVGEDLQRRAYGGTRGKHIPFMKSGRRSRLGAQLRNTGNGVVHALCMDSRIHGENDGWQRFSIRGVRVVHGVRRSGFVAQRHRHRQRDILGALSGRGAGRPGGGGAIQPNPRSFRTRGVSAGCKLVSALPMHLVS